MSEQKPDPKNTSVSTEENPPLSNIEKYNAKVKEEGIKPDIPKKVLELQTNLYDTLLATATSEAKGMSKIFKDKGDMDSAILILQESRKNNAAKPSPNTSSIPQPVGIPKVGLSKYMKFVPGTDRIEWNIPMSELMDPEKNKKLGDYN